MVAYLLKLIESAQVEFLNTLLLDLPLKDCLILKKLQDLLTRSVEHGVNRLECVGWKVQNVTAIT